MTRREEVLRLFDADPGRIADCVVGLEEQLETLREALREIADTSASADDDGLIAASIARVALSDSNPANDSFDRGGQVTHTHNPASEPEAS